MYYYFITMLNTEAGAPIITYFKYYKTARENDDAFIK